MILDMEENTLEFEINNEVLGVAFRGMLDHIMTCSFFMAYIWLVHK